MSRLILILTASLFAAAAAAQSLADVAAKEKKRREKIESKDTRTITDQDLKRGPRPLTSSASTTSEGTEGEKDTDTAEDAESEPEDPTKTESYWRDRLSGVDKRIKDLEAELQSPLYTANPRGGPQRQALERRLAQAKSERQTIVAEARRKGVPPGWLR